MSRAVFGSLILASLAAALVFRAAAPLARPMHHDEANQAVRFGILLETGQYEYDRNDHHGPTLYYLTLPVAWLRGQTTLASLDERTVRLVPAIFGTAMILLFLPLVPGLGREAVAASAILAALSPVLTYYGRFYIQETLFAFFALAFLIALGRYVGRARASDALWAGAFAGLAFATKETTVVILPAALLAAIAVRDRHGPGRPACRIRDIAQGLAVALAIAFIFYSSFFSRPAGFVESIRAFGVYFDRGLGASPHVQPWDYYLRLLAYSASDGLVWSEGLVLVLALVGAAAALRRQAGFWPRYVAVFSAISAVAFAAIPYKTPWNLLPFYVGVVLMAGCGAAALVRGTASRAGQGLLLAALAAGALHLGVQNWRANFRYAADTRNPYAYAQTSPDFLRLVQRVNEVSALHQDRERMLVTVLAGPYEQWPLPWYLRRMTNVGYWATPVDAGRLDDAPVIVASQENAGAVDAALGDRYVSAFYGLRPDVLLTVYVERGLWERFLATRQPAGGGTGPPPTF